MRVHSIGSFCLSLLLVSVAIAQDNNGLNRPEVAAIKAKLVAVRAATGGEPSGYALESEDFSLPTKFNPARDGKFWPITSSVYLRFTDKAVQDAQANSEQAAADFQARYMAAVMSGNETAMQAAMSEMMQAQNGVGSETKEDMMVNIQFNMNPYAGIDPDGVLFEKPVLLRWPAVMSRTNPARWSFTSTRLPFAKPKRWPGSNSVRRRMESAIVVAFSMSPYR
jgi:hypothetical protein